MIEHADFGGERADHVAERASQGQRALGGAAMGHRQIVAMCEVFDGVQIFAARAVAVSEFIASEINTLRERASVELFDGRGQSGDIVLGAQAYGDIRDFRGIGEAGWT